MKAEADGFTAHLCLGKMAQLAFGWSSLLTTTAVWPPEGGELLHQYPEKSGADAVMRKTASQMGPTDQSFVAPRALSHQLAPGRTSHPSRRRGIANSTERLPRRSLTGRWRNGTVFWASHLHALHALHTLRDLRDLRDLPRCMLIAWVTLVRARLEVHQTRSTLSGFKCGYTYFSLTFVSAEG